jgi:membrane protein DedA with SNARE-associated domain
MTTHYALTQAIAVAQDLEAKGFLGTVGKIAAATIIFFIAIGLIVGLFLGYLIGKAVGRRQGPRD